MERKWWRKWWRRKRRRVGSTIGMLSSLATLSFGFLFLILFFVYAAKYYASILISLTTLAGRRRAVDDRKDEGENDWSMPLRVSIHIPFLFQSLF